MGFATAQARIITADRRGLSPYPTAPHPTAPNPTDYYKPSTGQTIPDCPSAILETIGATPSEPFDRRADSIALQEGRG
jgi:hypothetical protein